MHAIRQKCRPKHQVLILNCYPRTIKGTVDVLPNSSELSYLLYYATTRRSKVQKVGAFLEKKTASDVWRARIGNVQVTLHILAALIEKAPRDLPLYAPHVLKLLNIILRAHDVTMVESSLPTFQSFCQHHDEASLSADQEYLSQYEEIVSMYASLASPKFPVTNLVSSAPVTLKWRSIGLQAIESVVSSEALVSVASRQLDLIVPILLENIWSENPDYIKMLERKAQVVERIRTKSFSRRRPSATTIQTTEKSPDTTEALSGTTADADKVAEVGIGALAVQCLKLIFAVNNKAQIRGATLATLRFIGERADEQKNRLPSEERAIQIFQIISGWAPVQDRYTILITAIDVLIRCSIERENLQRQFLLATMIDSLLKSDINLIGLSVMDVLLTLIHHLLRILQSSRPCSQEVNATGESQWPLNSLTETLMGSYPSTVLVRQNLLDKLQDCIGHLATHVYYADQISDMVSALLWRLKPRPNISAPNIASADEEFSASKSVFKSTSEQIDDLSTERLFHYTAAKVRSLEVIKSILTIAGLRKNSSGVGNLARNSVSIWVWEGTQWLLYDTDYEVRKSYVAALLTWMEYEMAKPDILVPENKTNLPTYFINDDPVTPYNKRAVSNTVQRERNVMKRPIRSTFLELLHLVIYENALKYSENEDDVILLHLLLYRLVENLGMNAVKNGLPMIFRLQEDISDVTSPIAKIQIGSLCHGYFWTLCENFKLNSTPIDIEIHREIHRRQKGSVWNDKIRHPPLRFEQFHLADKEPLSQKFSLKSFNSDALRAFTKRSQMVQLISSSYVETLMMEAASSPVSPTRNSSQITPNLPGVSAEFDLPDGVKELLMLPWSRDSVILAIQERSRTVSLNGSKAATTTTRHKNFLSMSGNDRGNSLPGTRQTSLGGCKDSGRSVSNHGLADGLGGLKNNRRSSRNSITRVEHLKKVLSGRDGRFARNRITGNSDASSDSLVSYAYTTSEISFNRSQMNLSQLERTASNCDLNEMPQVKTYDNETINFAPLSSNPFSANEKPCSLYNLKRNDAVPPMPSIPKLYKDEANIASDTISSEDAGASNTKRTSKPKGQVCLRESTMSLENFLNDIDVGPDNTSGTSLSPPY